MPMLAHARDGALPKEEFPGNFDDLPPDAMLIPDQWEGVGMPEARDTGPQ